MSILIAEHINKALMSSEKLKEQIGNRMFLEGLQNDTKFPYLIYDYNVQPDERGSSKDNECDLCNVVIGLFSDEAFKSLELADEIRKAMQDAQGEYEGFEVTQTEFDGFEGSFESGCYVRILRFNIYTSRL